MNRNWTIITMVIAVGICLAGFTHHSIAQGKQKLPDLKKVMVDHPDDPSKKISLANLVKGYKKAGSAKVSYPMNRAGVCVVSIDYQGRVSDDEVPDVGTWVFPVDIAQNQVIDLFDEIDPTRSESFLFALIDGMVSDSELAYLREHDGLRCYDEDTSGCATINNESLQADVFRSDLSINIGALRDLVESRLLNAVIAHRDTEWSEAGEVTCYYEENSVSLSVCLLSGGPRVSCFLSSSLSYDELKPYLKEGSPLRRL